MVELSHLKKPNLYLKDTFLELDHSTRRNLELTERLHGGSLRIPYLGIGSMLHLYGLQVIEPMDRTPAERTSDDSGKALSSRRDLQQLFAKKQFAQFTFRYQRFGKTGHQDRL
jgi:hypothetical protein